MDKLVKLNCALVLVNNSKHNINIFVNGPYYLKFIRPTKIDIFLFYFPFLPFFGAYIKQYMFKFK